MIILKLSGTKDLKQEHGHGFLSTSRFHGLNFILVENVLIFPSALDVIFVINVILSWPKWRWLQRTEIYDIYASEELRRRVPWA